MYSYFALSLLDRPSYEKKLFVNDNEGIIPLLFMGGMGFCLYNISISWIVRALDYCYFLSVDIEIVVKT